MAGPNMLARAVELATKAHEGQFRRGGRPYIDHPISVMESLAAQGASNLTLQAAVLHDVVEDTPITLAVLEQMGFDPKVVWAVDLLTKGPDETVRAYYAAIRSDEIARAVKVADIVDNLTDAPRASAIERYTGGLLLLADAI